MHNFGQMTAAYFIIGRGAAAMLPLLMMSGMVTGIFTGVLSAIVIKRSAGIFGKRK